MIKQKNLMNIHEIEMKSDRAKITQKSASKYFSAIELLGCSLEFDHLDSDETLNIVINNFSFSAILLVDSL